ncbi:MAG: riboflavin biosynthesis protein RibF [Bacteroidales bacterium]|nr:riboflavin biosynthesis protein RibF [Bacteroidales bacterium]HPD94798.1 riboflavin kinase [Tenuifilaceae bacterium]HRX30761.1 riboflavin kinase [Tenuifilaceae bacterium]
MKVHYGFDDLEYIKNPVVTTGSFDGVHVGHKTILNRIIDIARNIQGESVLITFYPHPRKVLYPETEGKNLQFILSQREKIDLLEKVGIDHLIIVNFTLEFSHISSVQFIKEFLIDKLHAKYIVVGFNHHFGHNREGDYEMLYKLSKDFGFSVEEIPEQDIQQETVSSTTIRKALLEGKIQRANAYLDHQYIIIGALGKGSHFFKQVGFPTMTVQIEEVGKLIPPSGCYAVSLKWNSTMYKAMAIIWVVNGEEDISNSNEKIVEVHIVDFDNKFFDNDGTLLFHKQISDNIDISNKDMLKTQLSQALEQVEELIY